MNIINDESEFRLQLFWMIKNENASEKDILLGAILLLFVDAATQWLLSSATEKLFIELTTSLHNIIFCVCNFT